MGVAFSILRLLCCHVRCSPTRLSTLIAFVPPQPGSYHIFDGKFRDSKTHLPMRLHPSLNKVRYEAFSLSSEGDKIPCLAIRQLHSSSSSSSKWILFAHGNATDLGLSLQSLGFLAQQLGVNVLAYDYPGYGAAEAQPIDLHRAHRFTLQVYQHLIAELGCASPDKDLILYGQSLGSVFVCELLHGAAVAHAGVVLHSPLASGVRLVLNPANLAGRNRVIAGCLCCLEVFPNERRLARAATKPVFVIHGMRDQAIPHHHGQALHNAVPKAELRFPGFFPDADHNDVDIAYPEEYFARLREFMEHCWGRGAAAGEDDVCCEV